MLFHFFETRGGKLNGTSAGVNRQEFTAPGGCTCGDNALNHSHPRSQRLHYNIYLTMNFHIIVVADNNFY